MVTVLVQAIERNIITTKSISKGNYSLACEQKKLFDVVIERNDDNIIIDASAPRNSDTNHTISIANERSSLAERSWRFFHFQSVRNKGATTVTQTVV